jgi:hypothetical protein
LKERNNGKLLFKRKLTLKGALLRDGVIWEVPKSDRNPDGIRYRLALVDGNSGQLIALFDNHYPKGHHRHWEDGCETHYSFVSAEKLLDDYLIAIQKEVKKREDKKD